MVLSCDLKLGVSLGAVCVMCDGLCSCHKLDYMVLGSVIVFSGRCIGLLGRMLICKVSLLGRLCRKDAVTEVVGSLSSFNVFFVKRVYKGYKQ